MRDTTSMQAGAKNKELRLLLRFAKNRTVKYSESDDSGSGEDARHQLESSDDSISDKEEQAHDETPNAVMDMMKKSIIDQVRVKRDLKKQITEQNIQSTKIQLKKGVLESYEKQDVDLNSLNTS